MNNILTLRSILLGPDLINKCLSDEGVSEDELNKRIIFLQSQNIITDCDIKKLKNLCKLNEIPTCLSDKLDKLLNLQNNEVGNTFKQIFIEIFQKLPKDINLYCLYDNFQQLKNIRDMYQLNKINTILKYKYLLIIILYNKQGNNKLLKLDKLKQIFIDNKESLLQIYKIINRMGRDAQLQKEVFYTFNYKPVLAFLKILEYYSNNYNNNLYFLGDSVYKFKIMYDLVYPNNGSQIIKFSGNMFIDKNLDNIFDEKNIDQNYLSLLKQNSEKYYYNNKNLIDNLFEKLIKKEKIIIIDYITTGVSLLTLIYFLSYLNSNFMNRKIKDFNKIVLDQIIFVNLHTYLEIENIFKNLQNKINFISYEMDIDSFFFNHFTNSDKLLLSNLCSRCIPKYSPELWDDPDSEVYIETNSESNYKNYLGCNISNLEIIIFLNNIKNNLNINDIVLTDGKLKGEIVTTNQDYIIKNLEYKNIDDKEIELSYDIKLR